MPSLPPTKNPMIRISNRGWGGICALLLVLGQCACHGSEAYGKKLIVIGADGMDPGFVERHWSDLPNLARLRDTGGFRRLSTTTPPQSPVAWSTFITGLDPAEHGILDFVHRDPRTMLPFSSMSRTLEPRFQIPLGPYVLPLSPARVTTLRRGRAFWEILASRHIPITIMRLPVNFPPVTAGEALAGMGVPDLRGTQGTFTYFTDDPEELSREVPGGRIVKVHGENGRFVLPLEGPPNTLRKDQRFAQEDLSVDVDSEQDVARIRVGDAVEVMKQGEWSPWLRSDFRLLGWLASARGMVRIYAKAFHPRLALYATPVNVDPRAPDLPISTPGSFSRRVSDETGPFYTQGIAEDTAALRQGVFTLDEFLRQSGMVQDDEIRLLRYALRHFREGLLFVYFSSTDENAHMLWGKHEPELLKIYRAVDGAIGEAMAQFPDAALVVLSDHGFAPFDRSVNLNTWLWEQGFLALEGPPRGDDEGFADVNWGKTQAYALGLNGLYLNVAGREKNGVVKPGPQTDELMGRLRAALLELHDPLNGRRVVESVTSTGSPLGPDLIVGYARGYRGSWQTALGAAPPSILEDNTDAWIGDHCISADEVPGVLFSNRRIAAERPALRDIPVTILREFGAPVGGGMKGRTIY